jgi:hypothetical protein
MIQDTYFPDLSGPGVSPRQIHQLWHYSNMIVHQELCVLSIQQLLQLYQDQSVSVQNLYLTTRNVSHSGNQTHVASYEVEWVMCSAIK